MTEDYSTLSQQSTQTLDPYDEPYADEEYVRLTVRMYVTELERIDDPASLPIEARMKVAASEAELEVLREHALDLFKQGMTAAMGEPTEGQQGLAWYGLDGRCAAVWDYAHRVELMDRGFFEAHEGGNVTSAQVLAWLKGDDDALKGVGQ